MPKIVIKQFLEAGVHFGHQTKRWNPKMGKYIYGEKNGIHIIDLQKTVDKLKEACEFLQSILLKGETVLFVGTKKQAQDVVTEEAKRCEMSFVTHRWLGGMLTNFQTIKKSITRLKELERMQVEIFSKLTKKEIARLEKEKTKLEKTLGGVKDMSKLPGVIFIVDSKKEETAVLEAKKLNIPVIAVVDTNCDPSNVAYVIPANDDAIKSIKLICAFIADTILEVRPVVSKVLEEEIASSVEEAEKIEKAVAIEDLIQPKIVDKDEAEKAKKKPKKKVGNIVSKREE